MCFLRNFTCLHKYLRSPKNRALMSKMMLKDSNAAFMAQILTKQFSRYHELIKI
jgi:hypothetical protein